MAAAAASPAVPPAAAAAPQSARLLPQLESMGFPAIDVSAALALHADDGLSDAVALERCMAFLLSSESDRVKLSSAVSSLASMGFGPRSRVISALTQSKANAERAMERMLNEDEAAAREAERLSKPGGAANGASVAKPAASAEASLPPVTAQFSDEQVLTDLLVHRAVFARDLRALGEYAKRKSNLINTRDHRGRTPLLLAYALGEGWSDVVTFLLNRGADPRIKLPGGWSLLQQAALRRERALALDVHLHSTMLRQAEWDSSQASTIDALKLVQDFRLEIRWEIQSWIPLVGRLAPRDAFYVTKRGGDIRLDTKVVGMSGMSVIKGDLSYLFSRGTVWMLDREKGTVRDALATFRNPAYDELEMHVDAMCSSDDKSASDTHRSEMRSHAVSFKDRKNMWGRAKTTKVEGFQCREVVMSGLEFVDISLKDDAAASAAGAAGAAAAGSSSSSSASASPAPLATSSSAPVAGALSHEVLTADAYFVPSELEAYNIRRRIEAKVERKKRRRVRKAVVELQAAASSSSAAAASIGAGVGAGAASSSSSSSAAPAASSAAELAAAASSLAPLAASGSAPSSRRNSLAGSGSAAGSDEDDGDEDGADEATLQALPPAPTPPMDPSIVAKSTLVDATLCLSPDFPLPLSQLIVLLELLSPASSLLSKLRDLLTVQLPLDPQTGAAPFPVRITFPIFTQVNAAVTFAAFEPIQADSLPPDTFEIPKEFRRVG